MDMIMISVHTIQVDFFDQCILFDMLKQVSINSVYLGALYDSVVNLYHGDTECTKDHKE